MSDVLPETRYARKDDIHLAYQVIGSGDLDLVFIDTWVHHVEVVWEVPDFARSLRRLGSIGRLIHFDRRGTGLSDQVPLDHLPDFDTQVEDVIAILDAVGADRPAVIGTNDGTLVAILLAAAHPERCRALVLFAPTAKHELQPTPEVPDDDAVLDLISRNVEDSGLEWLAPSRIGDDSFDRQLNRLQRNAARPAAMRYFFRQTFESDVRDLLPAITVPTLVLNRSENRVVSARESREVANAIPGARFVELPGQDHLIFSQGLDRIVDEVEEFLTGVRSGRDPDRLLATLLFTDIVNSTTRAADVGDRRWRDLLDEHHRVVRTELDRFGGREVVTTGDGFFASFPSPTQAVRCAISTAGALQRLGIQIRAGVHTGEVEVRGSDLGGLAVHIGSRVQAAAAPGEVLVSSTVHDLLAGSDIAFDDRGEHELKGVPGTWRLYAASTPTA